MKILFKILGTVALVTVLAGCVVEPPGRVGVGIGYGGHRGFDDGFHDRGFRGGYGGGYGGHHW